MTFCWEGGEEERLDWKWLFDLSRNVSWLSLILIKMGDIILNFPPKNRLKTMDSFLELQVSIVAFCRFPEKLISIYFPHTLQNKDDHLICLHFFLHLSDYINIWSILQIFEILCISLHCSVCSKYVAQIKLYKKIFFMQSD